MRPKTLKLLDENTGKTHQDMKLQKHQSHPQNQHQGKNRHELNWLSQQRKQWLE